PLGNRVDVCSERATLRLPVTLHVPVAGSYSSAVLRALLTRKPPVIRTLPLDSSVAVWLLRAVLSVPVPVHVPVIGSYNSALLTSAQVCGGGPQLKPPATNTLPFGNSVAV